MPEPRMFLNEFSPMTQRMASSRFDLPQPFGPTTPVRPGSMMRSVGSTKDLKPESRRRLNFTVCLDLCVVFCIGSYAGKCPCRLLFFGGGGSARRSAGRHRLALQCLLDQGLELVPRYRSLDL